MNDIITVSLLQFSPKWEDARFNLSRLDGMIKTLSGKTDLIILPEMFPTGFSMDTRKICAASVYSQTLQWMQQKAKTTDAMLAGGVAVEENQNFYNRFYWFYPDGNEGYYNKCHLFFGSDEHKYFTAGTERKQFEWRGFQIKPIICYDLRFPEWCRNSRTNSYDILICAASWPTVRSDVWLTLLKARALENQCYVIGVNRAGTDGNGLPHKGDSIVYSPKGEIIVRIPENEETIATVELSLSSMNGFRRKFPVLQDIV